MVALVLGAAGSALGAGFGGTILGLSGAAIGGMIGSAVGSVADAWIVGSFIFQSLDYSLQGSGLASPGNARHGSER